MNPTYTVPSPRELFERIEDAATRCTITPRQADVLCRRLGEGRTLGEVGCELGVSKQAVEQQQRKALGRLGIEADLIERLLDAEKARRADVLQRRYRRCWSVPLQRLGNDLGVEDTGLDAAATRLLAGAC